MTIYNYKLDPCDIKNKNDANRWKIKSHDQGISITNTEKVLEIYEEVIERVKTSPTAKKNIIFTNYWQPGFNFY